MGKFTIIPGDFNTLNNQHGLMENEEENRRTEQHHQPIEPKWHHRILHPTTAGYTFFASVYGIFAKAARAWVLKQIFTSLTDTRQHKFFDHNEIKLEINHRKITRKSPNTWI